MATATMRGGAWAVTSAIHIRQPFFDCGWAQLPPPSALGSPWLKKLAPYRIALCSGWMQLRGARRRRGVDRGFVLSDHADWSQLNTAVAATGAEHVYVTHGYEVPFARWLREEKGLQAHEVHLQGGASEWMEDDLWSGSRNCLLPLTKQQRRTRRSMQLDSIRGQLIVRNGRLGNWWKWKTDPLTADGVLIYAQSGHGRRANLYTDYTFAVWDGEGALVPFAKAYSGLTDKEIAELDNRIKRNTLERFGPVRSVTPHHVFEIAFEGIGESSRHKSGVALRFPRMLRWRRDKLPEDANTKADLLQLIEVLK